MEKNTCQILKFIEVATTHDPHVNNIGHIFIQYMRTKWKQLYDIPLLLLFYELIFVNVTLGNKNYLEQMDENLKLK